MSVLAWIEELRHALADDGTGVLPPPAGASRFEDEFGVVVSIEHPLDAAMVSVALGFVAPVAVSFDVHQETWWVVEAGEELFDSHGRRIDCHELTLRHWGVRPRLTARPQGDLPGVSCGASPAYDLTARKARVGWIHIHAARQ